jgi:hypothetical protein
LLPCTRQYDVAKRDPALAAMILSKLNNGAMGAAGNGVPDKAAQQPWLESIREQPPVRRTPCRLHQHPSEVTVAGFGDPATPHAIPAGVFARNQTAVTHQLPGTLETGNGAKLGNDGGR